MPLPQIENLLIVQARDLDLQKNHSEQLTIPHQRQSLQDAIDHAQARQEQAAQDLKAQTVACEQLEVEIADKEMQITRFKNQQLTVKKNEEYQALKLQIEQTESSISRLEEQEIELMLTIDSARDAFENLQVELRTEIEKRQSELRRLGQKEQNLKAVADKIEQQFKAARQQLDAESIEHYDRVKKLSRRAPYIVPLQARLQWMSFARVNEVTNAVAKNEYPVFCDQCARMLFLA